MTQDILRTLLASLEIIRPALTAPGYRNAMVVFVGWVLSNGTHAITAALVATDVARRRHHEGFHRFFSRGSWSPDQVGRLLFQRIVDVLLDPKEPVELVLDDTLASKSGDHVFGIGSHLDAVRSTKLRKVFAFGHVWVVLAVVVRFRFSRRPWALPVLFRLYRNKKDCASKGDVYRKKTELARELMDIVAGWTDQRSIHIAMDSAYCNDTVLHDLPPRIVVFGAMRPDAVLTAAPTAREQKMTGRRRVRGKPLPKPERLATNDRRPWLTCRATTYGKNHPVRYKTLDAQWYRACGTRLIRMVVVPSARGKIPFRVFFCTDLTISVPSILETYAGRWGIEVCFRDLKQLLGFSDSSARKKEAVERTAPFVGFIYTTLVLWFACHGAGSLLATPPIRPWYTHKKGFSFADVLRTAQRVLSHLDVFDPAHSIANLPESCDSPGLLASAPRKYRKSPLEPTRKSAN